MATVDVVDMNRKPVRSLEAKGNFLAPSSDHSLVHTAVVMQRASWRQGTVSTKGRSEVRGGGRKPWKQKHTGRARAGSSRSPIWRGGGTVFGPKPRKYGFSLPRKMYREAMRRALSSKNADGQVMVVEGFSIPEPKTRHLSEILRRLGLSRTTLIVAGDGYEMLARAGKNLQGVKVVVPQTLNVYDILRYDVIVVLEEEFVTMQDLWA